MYVSKDYLLELLPVYRDKWVTVADNQDVHDIIQDILKAHRDYEKLYDCIGYCFIGTDLEDTCKNLYDFCVANIRYKEETEENQTVAVPQGILTRGYGDCKHYASFIGGCLGAIERYTGDAIDWDYCFASYKWLQPAPYHVFISVDRIPVDPTPGSGDNEPIWLDRITVNKNYKMSLNRNVAGIGNPMAAPVISINQLIDGGAAPVLTAKSTPLVNVPPLEAIKAPPDIAANNSLIPGSSLTNTQLLIAGAAGLGLLYLINKPASVGAEGGEGKKSKSMLPLLIIGGALAYWLYTKNQAANSATQTTPGLLPPASGGGGSDAGQPLSGQITVAPSVTIPTDDYAHNALFNYSVPWRYAVDRMSPAERQALYIYVFAYIKKNLRLYNYPGFYYDGWYDPTLYSEVRAVSDKWNMGLLN